MNAHSRSSARTQVRGALSAFSALICFKPSKVKTALAGRRVIAGEPLSFGRAVFPVFVTGLHCGWVSFTERELVVHCRVHAGQWWSMMAVRFTEYVDRNG